MRCLSYCYTRGHNLVVTMYYMCLHVCMCVYACMCTWLCETHVCVHGSGCVCASYTHTYVHTHCSVTSNHVTNKYSTEQDGKCFTNSAGRDVMYTTTNGFVAHQLHRLFLTDFSPILHTYVARVPPGYHQVVGLAVRHTPGF